MKSIKKQKIKRNPYKSFPTFKESILFYNAVKNAYNDFGLIGRNSDLSKSHEFEIHYERPFAYEFYHQFRKLQKCCSNENCSVFLTAETYKGCKSPDLVLHKFPSKRLWQEKKEGQYWACEIKIWLEDTSNLGAIEKDFEKFSKYFSSDLKFNHCIFLLVDATKDQLKDICNNITINYDLQKYFCKIVCVSIDHNKKIYANTLSNLRSREQGAEGQV